MSERSEKVSIDLRAKQQYKQQFDDWKIQNRIGHGSQGKSIVYKITKSNYTYQEDGALKIMNIMEQTGNYQQLPPDLKQLYDQKCIAAEKRAETEIQTMYQLKTNDHIVSCLDHRFAHWEEEDSYGEDLLIRMDLYESIRTHNGIHISYEEPEIIRLGKDICLALIACHGKGILHRDIKPDNIFKSENGRYLLGDFGVARITEHTLHAETMIGSYPYAAPEQLGAPGATGYDARIDIYGLGLTLYELANDGLRPFVTSELENDAIDPMLKRLAGEPLPTPSGVSDALAAVILKACAYHPQDRFSSAKAFYRALDTVSDPEHASHSNEAFPVPQKEDLKPHPQKNRRPSLKKKGILLVASFATLACLSLFLLSMRRSVVPDFCYVSKRHAQKLAGESNLQIKWGKDYSGKIEKGRVIKQSVKSGTKVKRGSTITLILSKGKKMTVVPDFSNKTWEEAQAEAQALHIKLSKKEEGSMTIEAGQVILQSIQSGSKIEENSNVELVVSLGPQQVAVPQLVGLTEEEAMQLCAKNGFGYKKIDQYGTSVDRGKILEQHIPAGEMVLKGTCIEVEVCVGAAP